MAALVATGVAVWSWLRPTPSAAGMVPAVPMRLPNKAARRTASIAPDADQRPGAARGAASSAADEAPCGADEAPHFEDEHAEGGHLVAAHLAPAGPHFVAAQQRVGQALADSADPFDQAIATMLDVGDGRTSEDRRDALVDRAAHTGDARVYALAFSVCSSLLLQREGCRHPWVTPDSPTNEIFAQQCAELAAEHDDCARLSARRWAELDADNGVPWLVLYDQARTAGDVSGQQEALAHLAAAPRFDQRSHAAAAAVAAILPDDEALAAKADLAMQAMVLGLGMVPFSGLVTACRDRAGGDANLAQQCVAVSDLLYEHGDALMAHLIGGSVYRLATGDPSRLDAAHAELKALQPYMGTPAGLPPCRSARDALRLMQRSAALGELGADRERARAAAP